MQAQQQATTKTSTPPGAAPTKAPASNKKAMMSGGSFEEQEQSLAPGGAADQARMAACRTTTDPKPYNWSVSYTKVAPLQDGDKKSYAKVDEHVIFDMVIVDAASMSITGLQGTRYETVDKGVDAGAVTESIFVDVPANNADFAAARKRADDANAKNIKATAPSQDTKGAMQCD